MTPERLLTRLKGYVLQHRDWTSEMAPRLMWLWEDLPGRCPRLSDTFTLPIHDDSTNPLGKLYGMANAAVTDENLRDELRRRIPPS